MRGSTGLCIRVNKIVTKLWGREISHKLELREHQAIQSLEGLWVSNSKKNRFTGTPGTQDSAHTCGPTLSIVDE